MKAVGTVVLRIISTNYGKVALLAANNLQSKARDVVFYCAYKMVSVREHTLHFEYNILCKLRSMKSNIKHHYVLQRIWFTS